MPPISECDRFADIYQVWTDTAASTQANLLAFYVDAYLKENGPVVELGVGDGRIAVAAAVKGRPVTGIDLSKAMLDRRRDDLLVTPDLIEQMRRTQLRAEDRSAAGADRTPFADATAREQIWVARRPSSTENS